jgi:hypothetical protein
MNSINLSDVSAAIDSMIALPVYGLLADMPADLNLKQFIVAKDNQCKLAGTQDLFRKCDFVASFDLPAPINAPDVDAYPDTAAGMKQFKEAMNEYKQSGKIHNDEIKAVAAKLSHNDILRKYQNLQRCISFVKSFDPAMFETNEELDLHELPENVRIKILSVYRAAFTASPKLLLQGSAVDLVSKNPICSLDTAAGIDAIIAVKNEYPTAAYGFVNRELLGMVIHSVKTDCNGLTLLRIASRLDTHLGGSKNATTILANLRMLITGIAPSKGKKAQ